MLHQRLLPQSAPLAIRSQYRQLFFHCALVADNCCAPVVLRLVHRAVQRLRGASYATILVRMLLWRWPSHDVVCMRHNLAVAPDRRWLVAEVSLSKQQQQEAIPRQEETCIANQDVFCLPDWLGPGRLFWAGVEGGRVCPPYG